jgi:N-acetylmuramoyl-L-alanine amidase
MRGQRSDSPARFLFLSPDSSLLPSRFSFLVCLFFLTLIASIRSAGAMVIRSTWVERRGEVFTIHLRLSGRPQWILSQQFGQLQIELLNTHSSWPPNQFLHAAVGPLGTVRIVSAPGGRVRMQIDVTGKCDYVVGRQHDQLIVSLARRGAALNIADAFTYAHRAPSPKIATSRRSAPAIVAAPARATAPEQIASAKQDIAPPLPAAAAFEPQAQGRPIVVVDPGHGGHDPGTQSADGLLEKDVALQIGRRLADALARRGVKPVMTRDSDKYLTLAQRTAIANNASAELFVSVHLNSSPNPGTTGMEVYYLNNTTDRATIRLARMENAADNKVAPHDPNLNYILSDLQQQYKATQSALLAQVMEQQTVVALQASFSNDIHGLGAKRGPFYVLVGPRIPAVLVECGFLSNSVEAQRLAAPAYQQGIADALAGAVVQYLNQDITAGTL